jgi:hypothetical protein
MAAETPEICQLPSKILVLEILNEIFKAGATQFGSGWAWLCVLRKAEN